MEENQFGRKLPQRPANTSFVFFKEHNGVEISIIKCEKLKTLLILLGYTLARVFNACCDVDFICLTA